MNLTDFITRSAPPIPWAEGDNIPWNDPGFSQRMLKEHLGQQHDAASRRFETIDRHVDWIHDNLLAKLSARILDLACGPGLYAERFARLGHVVHGIDYSPASIQFATDTATQHGLNCSYACQDIRQADYPSGMDLIMLIYGEFNVFRLTDARLLLNKIWEALQPGGILLLEPHIYQYIQQWGEKPASWYSSPGGLFSASPHIVLQENFWQPSSNTTTIRYHVIDPLTGQVTAYAQTLQAYKDDDYRSLLSRYGFDDIALLPGLLGEASPAGLFALVARKKGADSED
jgi:SAM-dependent methyltransferase